MNNDNIVNTVTKKNRRFNTHEKLAIREWIQDNSKKCYSGDYTLTDLANQCSKELNLDGLTGGLFQYYANNWANMNLYARSTMKKTSANTDDSTILKKLIVIQRQNTTILNLIRKMSKELNNQD